MFKCWILLKSLLGGMDFSLHLPLLSMNRINQTEPATFSVCCVGLTLRVQFFLYFTFAVSVARSYWIISSITISAPWRSIACSTTISDHPSVNIFHISFIVYIASVMTITIVTSRYKSEIVTTFTAQIISFNLVKFHFPQKYFKSCMRENYSLKISKIMNKLKQTFY